MTITLTPAIDGYRVWIGERMYAEFKTLTNASRCMAALQVLAGLDALPTAPAKRPLRLVSDRAAAGIVREMLLASVAGIGPEDVA